MAKENTFIDGMFAEKPHPNAPKWIKLRISINVQKFCSFAKEHMNEKGYMNIDLNKSKDGTKYYATLNNYKKSNEKKEVDESSQEIDANDIPF